MEEESKQKDKEEDKRRKQAARVKLIASKIWKKKASGKNDKWQVARERSKQESTSQKEAGEHGEERRICERKEEESKLQDSKQGMEEKNSQNFTSIPTLTRPQTVWPLLEFLRSGLRPAG